MSSRCAAEPTGRSRSPGTKDIDDALGGTLAGTLAALGATGEAGEVTKIATGGRLAAPLIVAVGIGADGGDAPIEPEVLRRAAGAAVRAVGSPRGSGQAQQRRIAIALPARGQAEAEAVALGALLGGYTFGRYRSEPAGRRRSRSWPAAATRPRRHAGRRCSPPP